MKHYLNHLWLATLFGALLVFARYGFQAISVDTTQYLLGAFREANDQFLQSDWFVNTTTVYHWSYVMWLKPFITADRLVLGLFLYYSVNAITLAFACAWMIKHVGLSTRTVWGMLLTIIVFGVGIKSGWGEYAIFSGQAIPASFGYPMALLSIGFLVTRRLFAALVALALTFIFHYGLGALMVLCLLVPALWLLPLSKDEWKRVVGGMALLASVVIPGALLVQAADVGGPDSLRIFFYGRAHHHYAPQFAELDVHAQSLLVFACALLLITSQTGRPYRGVLLSFVFGIAVLCLLGYVFLEIWYFPGFVRLFPYRAIPLLIVLNAILIGSALSSSPFAPPHNPASAVCCALSLLVAPASIIVGGVFFVAALLVYLLRNRGPGVWQRTRAPIVAVTSVALFAWSSWHVAVQSPPKLMLEFPGTRHESLSKALHEYVPETAITIVPPELMGLRLNAQRAIVVNFKVVPVFGDELEAWADRMFDLTDVDPRDMKKLLEKDIVPIRAYAVGYRNKPLSELVLTAKKYGAQYILVHVKSRFTYDARNIGKQTLWAGGDYELYKLW